MRNFKMVLWCVSVLSLSGCAGHDYMSHIRPSSSKPSTLNKGPREPHYSADKRRFVITGTTQISSPMYGYVTCFKNNNQVYINQFKVASPSLTHFKPKNIITRNGIVAPARCDALESMGLLNKYDLPIYDDH